MFCSSERLDGCGLTLPGYFESCCLEKSPGTIPIRPYFESSCPVEAPLHGLPFCPREQSFRPRSIRNNSYSITVCSDVLKLRILRWLFGISISWLSLARTVFQLTPMRATSFRISFPCYSSSLACCYLSYCITST